MSEILRPDGPPRGRGRSAPAQNGGTGHPWTYMPKSLSPPTKPHPHHPKALSPSLSSTWEDIKVKVVCRDSRTVRAHPRTLGISLIPLIIFTDFIMKVARVWGAPICFWTMICEINWGILLLVLRRCCGKNLVGRLALELKLWMNQYLGDFQLLFLNRWVADGSLADRE